MPTPTSAQIIAARDNETLKDRARALGALVGMTPSEVDAAWPTLVVAPVDQTGDASIASVLAYAQAVYDQALAALPPEPGSNLAAVTDAHILYALTPHDDATPVDAGDTAHASTSTTEEPTA